MVPCWLGDDLFTRVVKSERRPWENEETAGTPVTYCSPDATTLCLGARGRLRSPSHRASSWAPELRERRSRVLERASAGK